MKFLDLLRLSSASLLKRKIRTILTVLGVTIGVASIVVMVSLGLGAEQVLPGGNGILRKPDRNHGL